jgi:HK97 gp10 family phage protein
MFVARLEWDADPQKVLADLTRGLRNKILRGAVKEASKDIKDRVKANAQTVRRTGSLARSIGVKVRSYENTVVAVVGPRSQARYVKGTYTKGKNKGRPITVWPVLYLHLLEKGTKRSGAKPILGPALQGGRQSYLDTVAKLISEGIADTLAK